MSELQVTGCELRIANYELERGVTALKAGRRGEARRRLAQAVSADPRNPTAWLWLSRCLDDADQRRSCLRRVQSLDPTNEAARRALGREQGALLRQILGGSSAVVPLPAWGRVAEGSSWQLPPRSVGDPVVGSLPCSQTALPPGGFAGAEDGGGEKGRLVEPSLAGPIAAARCFDARRRRPAVAILVVAAAWPASQAQPAGGELLEASGIVRAEEVLVASEWGGRVAAVPVDEGDAVFVGEAVVQLDTALLDAQIEVARAAVALAEAGLAQAKAGTRPGQVAVAEAQLAQAKAACLAATQAISDTMALVENPQEIRLQIAVAQAQAEAAQHHVARAVALKDATEIAKGKFEEVGGKAGRRKVLVRSGSVGGLADLLPPEIRDRLSSLVDGVYRFGDLELHLHGGTCDLYKWVNVHIPLELHLMPNSWWQAWVGVNAAVAQQEGLEASLAHLYAQRAHPQGLEAMVDEALAALAQAGAQLGAAQAQVDGLRAGATREQIAALEARVTQAQAALDSLLTQRGMMTIASPVDGTVVNVVAHPGEVAAPGAPLLTVADLSELYLNVYLPETQIGRVHLGQGVQVAVDSFPGRFFEGQVIYIASRAEFTPRNVATKEERVNLVFAVEVRLPNDDGALKPGMPADAVFAE